MRRLNFWGACPVRPILRGELRQVMFIIIIYS